MLHFLVGLTTAPSFALKQADVSANAGSGSANPPAQLDRRGSGTTHDSILDTDTETDTNQFDWTLKTRRDAFRTPENLSFPPERVPNAKALWMDFRGAIVMNCHRTLAKKECY